MDSVIAYIEELYSRRHDALANALEALATLRQEIAMLPTPHADAIVTRRAKAVFSKSFDLRLTYENAPQIAGERVSALTVKLESKDCNINGVGTIGACQVFIGTDILGGQIKYYKIKVGDTVEVTSAPLRGVRNCGVNCGVIEALGDSTCSANAVVGYAKDGKHKYFVDSNKSAVGCGISSMSVYVKFADGQALRFIDWCRVPEEEWKE